MKLPGAQHTEGAALSGRLGGLEWGHRGLVSTLQGAVAGRAVPGARIPRPSNRPLDFSRQNPASAYHPGMSTPQNPDPTAPHAASAAENTALQSAPRTSPASSGLFSWVKSAGHYLIAALVAALLFFAYHRVQTHRAIAQLTEAGFRFDANSATIEGDPAKPSDIKSLGDISLALRHLSPRYMHLTGCTGLTAVEGLPAGLQSLYLQGCTGLTSLDRLPAGIHRLDLTRCTGLTTVDHLPPGLQELRLQSCPGLTAVEHLPAGLQTLDLTGCTGLTAVDHLPPGLQDICLESCNGLSSLDHLPAGLLRLDLTGCVVLTSVENLPAGLELLWLNNCVGLTSLGRLPDTLKWLDVGFCKNLVRLGPLPPNLRWVDIRNCPALDAETRGRLREWAKGGVKGERELRE